MPDHRGSKEPIAERWRFPVTFASLTFGWLCALFSNSLIRELSEADRWFDTGGWLMLGVGLGLQGWARHEISGRQSVMLVDTGPYALCRHPQYWGFLWLTLAQCLMLRSVFFLMAAAIPISWHYFRVVPAEEDHLCEIWGEMYHTYSRNTPRWMPQWSRNVWKSLGLVESDAYDQERIFSILWLGAPFAAELVCYYRNLPGWPHWPFPL